MPTQRQHIDSVAARVNLPPATVARVIRSHHEALAEVMATGEKVVFSGFGSFVGDSFRPGPALMAAAPPAKKAPAKKAPAKKAPAKKAPAKKAPAKKAPAKKAPAKKAVRRRPRKA